jgi:hypothetical protein
MKRAQSGFVLAVLQHMCCTVTHQKLCCWMPLHVHLQLIRLCNAIHKRLGKHEVIPRARLLILIARCSTPFNRSGVNVQVRGGA